MEHGYRVRINLVFSAFLLWAAVLAAHLFFLQFNPEISTYYAHQVEQRWHSFSQPEGRRGRILFRDGSLLAGNRKVARVLVEPELVKEHETYLDRAVYVLAAKLNMEPGELRERITSYDARGLEIADSVPIETAVSIDRQGLRGVFTRYYYERMYPFSAHSAAATVGYAGKEPVHRLGLEAVYNEQLTGENGLVYYRKDADRKHLPGSDTVQKARLDGMDLTTTLHPAIQMVCEDELRAAMAKNRSKWGCVLVMDPGSGEILGAATAPSFDPNKYVQGELGPEYNVLIHSVVEPGSTVKPLVASYAIDQGWLHPDQRFVCNQVKYIDGYRIREAEGSHVGGNDGVPIREIIVKSSNVGMAQVALKLGQHNMLQCFSALGFFEKTGVQLPNESAGLAPYHYEQKRHQREMKWPNITLANTGFGQGLSVTPLQLATAYCTLANGGYKVRPTLVPREQDQPLGEPPGQDYQLPVGEILVSDSDADLLGSLHELDGFDGRIRVLSNDTCMLARKWLTAVVAEGTGTKAQLERFTAAGKTGTAQIYSPSGGYKRGAYNSLFVGFFPVENPRYMVLVLFSEPQGAYYGGEVAAPVFKAVGDRISYIDELGLTEGGDEA